ncbi:hypothetical protein MRB53_025503 [Persea americana]|uniref:Uncharacterized protein n=1 Tax=Persea americana TaxID=3435 RepID=A0ACC2LFM9_PERAE|nr:hypothetical protein MRB53_025503 [Persea americana]
MSDSSRGEFVEEFIISTGLISVQIVYAIYAVFLSHLLTIGLHPLFLVIYGSLVTSLILAPFAFLFERSKWPQKLNPLLLLQFVMVAFGGVTFQGLMLLGIKNTSPAIASAMPNLAPGLIFIIAWCFKLEKVDPKCIYSKAKIMGTLVCLAGAVSMNLLQYSPLSPSMTTQDSVFLYNNFSNQVMGTRRIIGSMYLLAAIFIVSCTMVLQARTMGDFPAPMSLCVATSFIGSILTVALQLIQEGKLSSGVPSLTINTLLSYTILAGIVNGLSIAFQAWCVKKRGPVLVSMFSPVGTVCSVIVSGLTLGEPITIGSVAGMFLMFTGLYVVLWAKKREGYNLLDDDDRVLGIHDTEKPLLS